MASFADITNIHGSTPLAWQLYGPQLQQDDLRTETGLQGARTLRDFQQYHLPDLASSFAARGTFHSGRRKRELGRLGERTFEAIGDPLRRAGMTLADLDTYKVGRTIGAPFGG